jgi:hypothetical protein
MGIINVDTNLVSLSLEGALNVFDTNFENGNHKVVWGHSVILFNK